MSQTAASVTPISPLRRRMIEDMTIRGFGEKTATARMPGPQPPRGKYPHFCRSSGMPCTGSLYHGRNDEQVASRWMPRCPWRT